MALTLARARIMGARYPYYLLSDSRDGQLKESEVTRQAFSNAPTFNDIRQGFVYERVPHITLKSIANNAEIDVIWEKFQERLEPLLETGKESVSISTMHRAKGLEFRTVAVMACDDEVIPLQERIETVADDSDLEEVYETERHLLYVACTRASGPLDGRWCQVGLGILG